MFFNKKETIFLIIFLVLLLPFCASFGIYESYQDNLNSDFILGDSDNLDINIFLGKDYLLYKISKEDNYYLTCDIVSDLFIKKFSFKNEIYFIINNPRNFSKDYVELICNNINYSKNFNFSNLNYINKNIEDEITFLISKYNEEYSKYLLDEIHYEVPIEYIQLFSYNEEFFESKRTVQKTEKTLSFSTRSLNNPNSNDYVSCDWSDNSKANPWCYYGNLSGSFVNYNYKGETPSNLQYDAISAGGVNIHTVNVPEKNNEDFFVKYSANFVIFGKNSADTATKNLGYGIEKIYNNCNGNVDTINYFAFGSNSYTNNDLTCSLNNYKNMCAVAKISIYAKYKQDDKIYEMSSSTQLGAYETISIQCSSHESCEAINGNVCKITENMNSISLKCVCENTPKIDDCLNYANGHYCDGDTECYSGTCVGFFFDKKCANCAKNNEYASGQNACCDGLTYDKSSGKCVSCLTDSDCYINGNSGSSENECNGNSVYNYIYNYKCNYGNCITDTQNTFIKSCTLPLFNDCKNGECSCTDTNGCDTCLNKLNGFSCNCDDECSSGYCSKSKCVMTAVCGDGICHNGESCIKDCFEISSMNLNKGLYNQNEEITLSFNIKNNGNSKTIKLTSGIVPSSWEGNYVNTQKSKSLSCFTDNSFFKNEFISINSGDSKTLSYKFNAPYRSLKYDNNNVLDSNMISFVDLGDCSSNDRKFSSIYTQINQCNNNNICEYGENAQNCRNDCPCNNNNICELTYENPKNCRNDCPCNNNNICEFENGETFYNCANDCKCNNNGFCDSFNGENEETCPKDCSECNFIDGSSYNCDCDYDSDCPNGYFCNQVSGPDGCSIIEKKDECLQHNDYYCKGNKVYYCEYNGKNYYEKFIDDCSIKENSICNSEIIAGTGRCETLYEGFQIWIDYANPQTKIYKQINDKLILNIQTEKKTSVNLKYDDSIYSSECKNGFISVDKLLKCEFNIIGEFGNSNIIVNKKTLNIEIIDYPENLYLTNSKKLFERFQNEAKGTLALLNEIYLEAEKNNGVVYDLANYDLGSQNPFLNYFDYSEEFDDFKMSDNSYAFAISNFVKERLSGASNVIVVGDDFVVPYYRREISSLEKELIFFNTEKEYDIYTDIGLIDSAKLTFSDYYEMFIRNDKYQGKPVMLILPENLSSEQRIEIDNLKEIFKNTNYKPSFTEINSKEVYCMNEKWIDKARRSSLIIIGTEENNRAFNCLPFLSGEDNRNMAFIQPNLWNNREYAIVINTNEPDVIKLFGKSIESGGIVQLKSSEAYYFHVGTQVAGYVGLGIGIAALTIGTGGTGTAILASSLTFAAGVTDGIADGADIIDSCLVNKESMFWCGTSITFAVVPLVGSVNAKKGMKAVANFIGDSDNYVKFLNKLDDDTLKVVKNKFPNLRKIFGKNWDLAIKSEDDIRYISRFLKESGDVNYKKILDDFIDPKIIDEKLIKNQKLSLMRSQGLNLEFYDAVRKTDSNLIKSKFLIEPDYTKKVLNLDDNFELVANKANKGVIVIDKKSKEIVTMMNEKSYKSLLNIEPGTHDLKNILREVKMEKILKSEGISGFIHTNSIKAEFIDASLIDPIDGRIKSIFNTGGPHTPEQIGTKIQKMRNYGFKFGNSNKDSLVEFYYDNMEDLKYLDSIKKTLNNYIEGSATSDSISFLEDGYKVTLKFIKKTIN